jgi:hypothetical protein
LSGKESLAVSADEFAVKLTVGFLFIEELQVNEIGNLLDVGHGVGYPACPQDVGDAVEFFADGLVHGKFLDSLLILPQTLCGIVFSRFDEGLKPAKGCAFFFPRPEGRGNISVGQSWRSNVLSNVLVIVVLTISRFPSCGGGEKFTPPSV